MAAIETFRFCGLTLRPAGVEHSDVLVAAEWTDADPDHREKVLATFWIEQQLGVDSYLLLDADGPVFFFRAELPPSRISATIHVQFPPTRPVTPNKEEVNACSKNRERVRRGMLEGLPWLERMLRQVGVREITFESEDRPLIGFAVRELGFKENGKRLEKILGQ